MKKVFLIGLLLLLSGCGTSVLVKQGKFLRPFTVDISSNTPAAIITPTVKMLFVGDIMLDRKVAEQLKKNGEDYLLGKLAEQNFFSGYDIVSGNLEGPFANYRRKTSKEIAFQFNPAYISILTKNNFNLVTIANNHSLDMGSRGLLESKENLQKAGIDFYGDAYGITASSTLIKEIPVRNASASVAGGNGYKIAFVGLNDTYFLLDENKIKLEIENAKKLSDFVIVNIHWGQEYQTHSNLRQQELAHLMIGAGADVIIGHHPHVVEEEETYQGKPIFYSLGNFIFDQYFSTSTQEGLAVALTISKDKVDSQIFHLRSNLSQVNYVN